MNDRNPIQNIDFIDTPNLLFFTWLAVTSENTVPLFAGNNELKRPHPFSYASALYTTRVYIDPRQSCSGKDHMGRTSRTAKKKENKHKKHACGKRIHRPCGVPVGHSIDDYSHAKKGTDTRNKHPSLICNQSCRPSGKSPGL